MIGVDIILKVGQQQQYDLGTFFRQRYDALIGMHYSPTMVYIRSSNMSRTLLSAKCNAAGMFSTSENWPSVPPIHTYPYDKDIIASSFNCPRYDHLYKQFTESSEFKYQIRKNGDLFKYLETNTGLILHDSIEATYLFVKLQDEKDHGLV